MARRVKWRTMSLLFAGLLLLAPATQSPGFAEDPPTPPGGFSFTEQPNVPPGSGYNPEIPYGPEPYGGSVWVYSDMTAESFLEGSYKPFDDQRNQLYSSNEITGPDGRIRTPGPHGSYATTSNKCSICHAVHKSTGTYRLLRVNTASDSCDYCHVGSHRHSRLEAYGDSGSIYSSNGHTIGAGPDIPESSTWQWNTPKRLSSAVGSDAVINVRTYDSARNRMFTWKQSDLGWERIGPVNLECITCHQPHNATDLLWNPNGGYGIDEGYKLLRKSPSGSVNNPDQMRNYTSGSSTDEPPIATPPISAPEGELSASTTGPGKTIYTPWKGPSVPINPSTISVWCADCHNLSIGYKEPLGADSGESSLSDRTHPVPFDLSEGGAQGTNGQCYSCHINDLNTGERSNLRLVTPEDYEAQNATSDFPHSGQDSGYKLLGDDLTHSGGPNNLVTPSALDGVCLRCHEDIGTDY